MYDIDGIYGVEASSNGECGNYMFVNRSGSLEALTTEHIVTWNGKKFIGNPHFEQRWSAFMTRCVDVLRKLEMQPPIVVALTLLDVKGFILYSGFQSNLGYRGARPIQHRDLNLPAITVTTYEPPVPIMLKPIFDALWNSCDLQRSFNYDETGNWAPQKWE